MPLQTTRWNSADHLKTDEDIQLYLEAYLEEAGDDPKAIVHALRNIAQAKNLDHSAREAGLSRDELDEVLSPDGNPSFTAVAKIARTLGLRVSVCPATV
ncbi:MAG: addiction module antidote protein [Cyanobacteria bacterium J06648_11]